MVESLKDVGKKFLVATIGPPFIAITYSVASIILFLVYPDKCKKCLLRPNCSKPCDNFKKRDEFIDIRDDVPELDLIPFLILGYIEFLIAIGIVAKIIIT
jgi:hypothetical protein